MPKSDRSDETRPARERAPENARKTGRDVPSPSPLQAEWGDEPDPDPNGTERRKPARKKKSPGDSDEADDGDAEDPGRLPGPDEYVLDRRGRRTGMLLAAA